METLMREILFSGCLAILSFVMVSTTPGCKSDSTSGNPSYNTNDTTSSHQGARDNDRGNGTKPGSGTNTDHKDVE
jgi:hypothetical protein